MNKIIPLAAGRELIYQATQGPRQEQFKQMISNCLQRCAQLIQAPNKGSDSDSDSDSDNARFVYYDFKTHKISYSDKELNQSEDFPRIDSILLSTWEKVIVDYFKFEFEKVAEFFDENDRPNVTFYLSSKVFKNNEVPEAYIGEMPPRVEKLFKKILNGTMVDASAKEERAKEKEDYATMKVQADPLYKQRKDLIERYKNTALPFAETPFFLENVQCTLEELKAYAVAAKVSEGSELKQAAWRRIFESWENATKQTRGELQITFKEGDITNYVDVSGPSVEQKNRITKVLQFLLTAKDLPNENLSELLGEIRGLEEKIQSILDGLHQQRQLLLFNPDDLRKVEEEAAPADKIFSLASFYKYRRFILCIALVAAVSIALFFHLTLNKRLS